MPAEAVIRYPHIAFVEGDVPILEGTTTKVIELVVEKMAYGWSPEEIFFQHPYLTLGQIHAGLSYYWDHADQFEEEIKTRLEKVDQLRAEVRQSPVHAKLQQASSRCQSVS
jgi:uncharacterized protein (DUF433 family)